MPAYKYTLKGKTKWKAEKRYKGKRLHKVGFDYKYKAEEYEDKWKREIDEGEGIYQNVSVKELAEKYLEHCEGKGLKAKTIRCYKETINNHIIPEIGEWDVSEVTPPRCQALINKLATTPRTANLTRTILKQLFKHATRTGILRYSPADPTDPVAHPKREMDCFTKEQATTLVGVGEPITLVALGCGLRPGEIFGLRWGDVDLERGAIKVRKNLTEKRELDEPKTEFSKRTVLMPSFVLDKLKELHGGQGDDELVFTTSAGTPIHASNYSRDIYYPMLEAAELPRLRPYALRHTHASLIISERVSDLLVSRRMGHSTIRTTKDFYGHLMHSDEEEKAMLEKLIPQNATDKYQEE